MTPAKDALIRLKDGNKRFAAGEGGKPDFDPARMSELAGGQTPFAIILGCSDSRVPAEIVFDQGLGDLFVIRVAGNIIAPSLIGSVEFAVEKFGTRLVVVLGHSMCGAVLATLEELERNTRQPSPNLASIVERIRPSVEPLLDTPLREDPGKLVEEAVRANVRVSVDQLQQGSDILKRHLKTGDLEIVGAEYCLKTGVVEFLDEA